MSSGANRIFEVLKNTSEEVNNKSTQLVELVVETINPLVFKLDDKLLITKEFYRLADSFDSSKLNVLDTVTAINLNNNQIYYILSNLKLTDINEIKDDIERLDNNKVDKADSGWINTTLSSSFKAYGAVSGNIPRYRKINNIVEIVGAITPIENITDTGVITTIFTLPIGYRPSRMISKVCQGTGKNTWLLRIETNGQVGMQRYGITEFKQCNAGTWLPFEIIFTVD